MTGLARNGDGDQLLFIHTGKGSLFCDFGICLMRRAITSSCRAPRCGRLVPTEATSVLMVEATNTHYTLPDRGLLGPHAILRSGSAGCASHGRGLFRPAGR